jgi:hypothetical protein
MESMPKRSDGLSSIDEEDRRPSRRMGRLDFPVVGIGAFAGGLEAIELFLAKALPEAGLAYVIVQHLDPNHPSLLSELISHKTSMRVREVEDRTVVEPNCVYTIPPNKDFSILHGVLHTFDLASPSRPAHADRPLLPLPGGGSLGIGDRRYTLGRGLRRDAGTPGHQGARGARAGSGAFELEIRRYASKRDRHRPRRYRGAPRGTPREDRRVPIAGAAARGRRQSGRSGRAGGHRQDRHPAEVAQRQRFLPVQAEQAAPPDGAADGDPRSPIRRFLRPLRAGQSAGARSPLYGRLFLGSAESIGSFSDLFAPLDSDNRIYPRSIRSSDLAAWL